MWQCGGRFVCVLLSGKGGGAERGEEKALPHPHTTTPLNQRDVCALARGDGRWATRASPTGAGQHASEGVGGP